MNLWKSAFLVGLLASGLMLVACDSSSGGDDTCDPACGTGFVCQDGQCVVDGGDDLCDPACGTGFVCQAGQCVVDGGGDVCDPACGAGFVCQNGTCVEGQTDICDPACGAGFVCDKGNCVPEGTDDCVPACGDGFTCVDGACVTDDVCEPACGPGFHCESGACVQDDVDCDPACGDGFQCVNGACMPIPCEPACGIGFTCQAGECVADVLCDPECNANMCMRCTDGECVSRCGDDEECVNGQCQTVCVPNCDGKDCGDDGCDGFCGDMNGFCAEGQACSDAGVCECVPDCYLKECGDDGCGGTCGECADGECTNGQCIDPDLCNDPTYVAAQCDGKDCGPDGCGGTCGDCADGSFCDAETFTCECQPNCYMRNCGDDGCGGSCGECGGNDTCNDDGICECVPSFTGECGDDGCGGSLGVCDAGYACVENACIEQTQGGLSCTEWYACANACPPGPNQAVCIQECDNSADAVELAKKNALESCRETRCNYCGDDPDPNACYSTCTAEQCGDEYMSCLESSFCNPNERDDCLDCGGIIGCQNNCVDDQGNFDEACYFGCQDLATADGYTKLENLMNCLSAACPTGSPDNCWSEAQQSGGACYDALQSCVGPADFCDPSSQDDCLGCGAFIQCQNTCVDDAGNYDEACGDACFDLISQEGYEQLMALYDCLYEACPEGSPDSCWGEAQGPGGACEQVLTDCAGGGGPAEYCDPAVQDDCLGCGAFIQCQNGCVDDAGNYDEACGDACMQLITEEGYGQLVALYECLYEACPDGSPDSCWGEAQGPGGACEQVLTDCAGGGTPSEYCDPAESDQCLGCAEFIQCQNGCVDDAGNYDEACGDACMELITEEGYGQLVALYECLYEACPDGSPESCWGEAQGPGGACEQVLADCAGGATPSDYCDPTQSDQCLGCGEFIQCQNGCVDDAGNYDEACGDACMELITEDGYNALVALYECLYEACPDGSPESCWGEAQGPGGACEQALADCAGGATPSEYCDPTQSDQCLDCAGFIQCQNACADEACVQGCVANLTEEGYTAVMAVYACLEEACPAGSAETCYAEAQSAGGACEAEITACAGGAKAVFPGVSPEMSLAPKHAVYEAPAAAAPIRAMVR